MCPEVAGSGTLWTPVSKVNKVTRQLSEATAVDEICDQMSTAATAAFVRPERPSGSRWSGAVLARIGPLHQKRDSRFQGVWLSNHM